MHNVARENLPEPRERRTFPFGGTPLPSPTPSVVSTNSSRWSVYGTVKQHAKKPEKYKAPPVLPYILSQAGIEITADVAPELRGKRSKSEVPRINRQNYPEHVYGSYNNFGHWNVANNQCPWLSYENIPKWSTSNKEYGTHYMHPLQNYARGCDLRHYMDDIRRKAWNQKKQLKFAEQHLGNHKDRVVLHYD